MPRIWRHFVLIQATNQMLDHFNYDVVFDNDDQNWYRFIIWESNGKILAGIFWIPQNVRCNVLLWANKFCGAVFPFRYVLCEISFSILLLPSKSKRRRVLLWKGERGFRERDIWWWRGLAQVMGEHILEENCGKIQWSMQKWISPKWAYTEHDGLKCFGSHYEKVIKLLLHSAVIKILL